MMDASLLTQAVKFHGTSLVRHMCSEQQLEGNLVQKEGQELQGQGHMDIIDENFVNEIQRFIAQKADFLFTSSNEDGHRPIATDAAEDAYAIIPAMETFMGIPDHLMRDHFYNSLERRDILVGVISTVLDSGLVVSVLCLDGGKARDIDQLRITAFCPVKELPRFSAHENPVESFQVKDKVRGAVLSVNPETEKIIISLLDKTLSNDNSHLKLGLIAEDDFPVHYKRKVQLRGLTYDEILHSVLGFNNMGNTQCLVTALNQADEATFMRGLKYAQLSETDSAEQLRKSQSQRWAHKSVSDGITHFKAGRQSEAIGFLNKALQMDPDNVEALVARGAMYANNESYTRAIEDFQQALNVNPNHLNARKYMCETLIAQAGIRVSSGDPEIAENYYREALVIDHENEAARQGLRHLQQVKREKAAAHFRNASPEKLSPSRAINDRTAQTLKKLIDEDTELSKERKKRKRSGSGDAPKYAKPPSRDTNIFAKHEIQGSSADAVRSMDRHSDVSPLASRRIGSNKGEHDGSPSLTRYAESTSKDLQARSYHVQEIKDIRRVVTKDEYGGSDRMTQGTSAQSHSYQHDDARFARRDDLENIRDSAANKYSSSRYDVLSDAKVRHQAGVEQQDQAEEETKWRRTITSVSKANVDKIQLPDEETRSRKSRWSPDKSSYVHQDDLPYQQSSDVLRSRKSRSPTSRYSSDSEISHTPHREDSYFRKTADDRITERNASPDRSMASGSNYHSRSLSGKRSTHRLPMSRSRSRSYSPKAESHSSRHSKKRLGHKHKDVTEYDQQQHNKEQDRGQTSSTHLERQQAMQCKEYRTRFDKPEDSHSRRSDALSKPLVLSGSEDANRSLSFGRWDSPEIQTHGLMRQRRFEQKITLTDRTLLEDVKASVSSITNRMVSRPTAQKFESVDTHNLPDIVPGLVITKQGPSREVIVGKKVRPGNLVSDSHQAASQSRASGSGRNEGKNDTGSSRSKSKDGHKSQKSRKDQKPAEKKRDKSSSNSRHRSKKRKEKSRTKQRHHSKMAKKHRRRSSSSSSRSSSSSSWTNRKRARRRSPSSQSSSSSSSSSSSYSRSPSPKQKRLSMDAGKQKSNVSISYVSAVKRPSSSMEKLPVKMNPKPNKTLSELEKFLLLLKQKKKEQTGNEKK